MGPRPTPVLVIWVALLGVLLGLATTYFTLARPWLGVKLAPDPAGPGVLVTYVDPDGPSAAVPEGARLVAVESAEGRIDLRPFDAVEDPDTLESYVQMDEFLERQSAISHVLAASPVVLVLDTGVPIAVAPHRARPLGSLPWDYWLQMATGIGGILIGAWILGFRPGEDSARLLALNGIALLFSCFGALTFVNRELAIDGTTFRVLTSVNIFGSVGYAVSLLAFFLVYPARLVINRVLLWLAAAFLVWWLMDAFHLVFPGPAVGRLGALILTMLSVLIVAGIQYARAGADPRVRAILRWFALTIAAATAVFIVLYVLPLLLFQASQPQGVSYSLGIVVMAGLVVGVARYRMFELETWAFHILFYVAGAIGLVLLDVVLIYAFAIDRLPALGLALLVIVLVYLPMRDVLARLILPSRPERAVLFRDVVDAALASSPAERDSRWHRLLKVAFAPLEIAPAPSGAPAGIAEDGLALVVAATAGTGAMSLRYARGGRRLFAPADAALANELSTMLAHASESRDAFEKGAAEERARIARDMHDNIGAKLLSALHGTAPERKDAMVREALADLRSVINNASGSSQPLDEVLAELRLETAERLSDGGLDLEWIVDGDQTVHLSAGTLHALRSTVREAVSNTLKHAGAARMTIRIVDRSGQLALSISDDGRGLSSEPVSGTGLQGIRERLESLSGSLQILEGDPGLRLEARLPHARAAG